MYLGRYLVRKDGRPSWVQRVAKRIKDSISIGNSRTSVSYRVEMRKLK
jgi:hypothetical protein